jgi:hypothetical protein
MTIDRSTAWRRAFLFAVGAFCLTTLLLVWVGRAMIAEERRQAIDARAAAEHARQAAEASRNEAAEWKVKAERKLLEGERKAKVLAESGLSEALVQWLGDDPEALVNAILNIRVVDERP